MWKHLELKIGCWHLINKTFVLQVKYFLLRCNLRFNFYTNSKIFLQIILNVLTHNIPGNNSHERKEFGRWKRKWHRMLCAIRQHLRHFRIAPKELGLFEQKSSRNLLKSKVIDTKWNSWATQSCNLHGITAPLIHYAGRRRFFYNDKSQNSKRYPFANVKSCHSGRENSIKTNCNL